MGVLKREEHETFAVLVASGADPTGAYAEALHRKGMTFEAARKGAARWLKIPAVANRVSELKADMTQRNRQRPPEDAVVLTKEQALELLSGIACDEEQKGLVRISAIGRLSQINGWDAPQETHDTLKIITEMPGPRPPGKQQK